VIIDLKFKKLLDGVHKKHRDSYLIVDAIGEFEQGDKAGYGYLGRNNSKFVVKRIISIQLVKKE